ncbi:MAG: NAD(P)/FAD-dependent oxidoreductase [Desulfurococcales archaeon]|nr:NAD(P)/FAD-dependent oxidoreductase [Desulfurococcales archaeon]
MRVGVVGGGFSGLMAAYRMLELGFDVELFEEHGRVGYPPHCTGVVSQETVEGIGRPAKEALEASYEGLIITLDQVKCKLRTREGIAKLNRVGLEEILLREVSRRGTPRLGARVKRVTPQGSLELASGEKISYDIVILAEGVHGKLRAQIGLLHNPTTSLGVNIEIPGSPPWEKGYFKVGFAPAMNGYTWEVPVGDRLVVGALSIDPREAVRAAKKLAGDKKRLRVYGGRVIHGPPLPRARRGRVVVIGDAAGVNKPVTGGGLWPNTVLVNMWAGLIESGLDILEAFDKAYSSIYSRLYKQYKLARAFYEASARERTKLLRFLGSLLERGLCDSLNGRIGYDSHEELFGVILRDPRLLLKAAPLMLRNIDIIKKIIL